jgi:hypothetical protein
MNTSNPDLETLCHNTGETFNEDLTKSEASKRIDVLRERSPARFRRAATFHVRSASFRASLMSLSPPHSRLPVALNNHGTLTGRACPSTACPLRDSVLAVSLR